MVSAMDMSAVNLLDSPHHEHSQAELNSEELLASCVADSNCDHFCHISSHMLGFISQLAVLPKINETAALFSIKPRLHSLTIAPPFLPPRA